MQEIILNERAFNLVTDTGPRPDRPSCYPNCLCEVDFSMDRLAGVLATAYIKSGLARVEDLVLMLGLNLSMHAWCPSES